jgi:integrase
MEARVRRDKAKTQIEAGINPSAAKRLEREVAQREDAHTFEAIAREWHTRQAKTLDDTYSGRVIRYLEKEIFPHIGTTDVGAVDPAALLAVIRRIEARGAEELPRRVLRTCGQVFRYAIATGRAKLDPSYAIRDALAPRSRVQHRAALQAKDLPAFFAKLAAYPGSWSTIASMKFTILTAARTGEVRKALRSEIEDLDGAALWRIPAGRMKMHREHIVPLSTQARALLVQSFARTPDSELLFHSDESRNNGIISENAGTYALYRMGYYGVATMHGWRGSFSTIANEHEFNRDWIELCLAHADSDDIRGAYNSASYLPQRRKLLQWWADYLTDRGLTI